MGGDVARVAHRQAVVVRGAAELFDDFEGRGFLTLQAEGVDRVHDGHRRLLGHLLDQFHALVEVAADLHDHGAVHHRLGQFAHGDLTFRDDHEGGDAGAGGVGRRRRGGVAGGRADDGIAALFHRLGHRHGHAPVLERSGGVEAFVFDVDVHVLTEQAGNVLQADQRRVALAQADQRRVVVNRQMVTVTVDQAGIAVTEWHVVSLLSVRRPAFPRGCA